MGEIILFNTLGMSGWWIFNEEKHKTILAKELFKLSIGGTKVNEREFEKTFYKVINKTKKTYHRVAYIYLDGSKQSLDDINKLFNSNVRNIIDGLTKLSGVFDLTTSAQAENFRKMLLTIPEDIRVILIKLADRLHNMRTLGSMRDDKRLKIASETSFLYAPIAHRLGLNNIKTELEDLSFKYMNQESYSEIEKKLSPISTTVKLAPSMAIQPLGIRYAIHSLLQLTKRSQLFGVFRTSLITPLQSTCPVTECPPTSSPKAHARSMSTKSPTLSVPRFDLLSDSRIMSNSAQSPSKRTTVKQTPFTATLAPC